MIYELSNRHNKWDIILNFLNNAGSSLTTFRYYEKRGKEVLDNHLWTAVEIHQNESIAYGHLDKEGDNVWLGICVIEKYRGMGYGKKMMNSLILAAKKLSLSDVVLGVDIDNAGAKVLYEKYGFIEYDKNNKMYFMKLKIGK